MCGRRSNLFNLSGTHSAKCRLWILTYVPYTYLFSRAISFHLEMHLLSRSMLFRVGHCVCVCVCVTPIYVYTRYFFDYYISSSLSFRFQLFFSFALSLWDTRGVYIFPLYNNDYLLHLGGVSTRFLFDRSRSRSAKSGATAPRAPHKANTIYQRNNAITRVSCGIIRKVRSS